MRVFDGNIKRLCARRGFSAAEMMYVDCLEEGSETAYFCSCYSENADEACKACKIATLQALTDHQPRDCYRAQKLFAQE